MIAFLQAKADGLWTRSQIRPNLIAGLIVGIVALPLAMAFAIASGARPEQGLYTAIIAAAVTSLFGGTRLQISGPTGAFVAVLSIITAEHGIAGLQIATLLAGIILIIFGVSRLGAVIRFIPHPVIAGFTAGIGVIIFVGQWKDFLGLTPAPSGVHFHEKLWALLRAFPSLNVPTAALALGALAILLLAPRIQKRIPAPLIALVAVTVIQSLFHFNGVATIGSAFGGIPRTLPVPSLPSVSFAQVVSLIGPAFTIALLGAIESLLSAVVADGMAGTRHDANQELIGQGIANFLAPLLGGFAATGAIARTATNIRSGATSPLAGLVHSAVLLLVILLLAPIASAIPLCCLSAILFVVAWNMSELPGALRLIKGAPRPDVVVLLLTFFLTVFVDLVVAVNVGVIVAALLFMRRMAEAVQVERQPADADAPALDSADLAVFRVQGPLFFAAAAMLERTLGPLRKQGQTIVLRMEQVPFVDATGIAALEALMAEFRRLGSRVLLVELRPNVRLKLERSGFMTGAGLHCVFDTLKQALGAAAA
jgi:SulP family sulfate permease